MPFSIRSFRRLPLTYCKGFLFLITLLLLSSSPAYAEWVLVSAAEHGMTVYADPDTIRRKGELVNMWSLYDFKTEQYVRGVLLLSSKGKSSTTAQRSAFGDWRWRSFLAIWGKARWFIPTHPKASGFQFHHRVLITLCGKLRAASSDRAVLERLGRIIEMGSGWRRGRRTNKEATTGRSTTRLWRSRSSLSS